MNSEQFNKLKEGIKTNVEAYTKIDINDPNKAKMLKIIASESKLVNDNDNLDTDLELKRKRFNFDEIKQKDQKELDEKKHTLEETKVTNQKTIENDRLKLERDRLEFEKEKLKQQKELEDNKNKYLTNVDIERAKVEQKKLDIETKRLDIEELKYRKEIAQIAYDENRNKKDSIINTIVRVFEIGLPLAINAWLVLMQFRLVYKDDGRVPSEMKDLLKNVYRGK